MTTRLLVPKPTVEELIAELKIRAEANRKTASEAKKGQWKTHQYVCDRTAQELERIINWYEGV